MNKILLLILLSVLVSCKTSKSKIQTKKTAHTSQRDLYKKKPVPVVPKEVNNENQTQPATEILEATSKIKVTPEIVMAYIAEFKETAKENMSNHGVPASIALAQAILESGAGTGILCKNANNHFGIKCHKDWIGPSVKHDDDALQECFRQYNNALDSYKDYALFLKGRRWYDKLFKLNRSDYKAWAKGLKEAGYATDPKYPDKLIGLIERYQLHQFDAEVLGTNYVQIQENIDKAAVDNSNEYVVSQGDTLYSISKKFNVKVEDLRSINNLTDNGIAIGQSLKIK